MVACGNDLTFMDPMQNKMVHHVGGEKVDHDDCIRNSLFLTCFVPIYIINNDFQVRQCLCLFWICHYLTLTIYNLPKKKKTFNSLPFKGKQYP